jgi:ATP-binding cassette subfamily B protein
LNVPDQVWSWVPPEVRPAIQSQLASGETVVAIMRHDLRASLTYAAGFVILTDRRLLSLSQPQSVRDANEFTPDTAWESAAWPLADIDRLVSRDRGGLGTLEALSTDRTLASWNFTLSGAQGVQPLLIAFDGLRRGETPHPEELEIPEAETPETAANVGSLFRLLRFARGHAAALALGMILTLTSTAVGLVPIYLTQPLVDDILLPYDSQVVELKARVARQEITPADAGEELSRLRARERPSFGNVPWYLAGMAVAAIAAWGLGWAQGWTLAWVSERISANLRNTTYQHLQRLSLDFFSARRTGDLVARISSDTDRICNFLSDNLTDFLTDILTIAGTVVILFFKDPLLALAALLTFPIVGGLTYRLRERLTHGFLHGSRAWGEMTSILADTIPGIRVVKAFAQEHREVERFHSANDRILAANDRVNAVWTFFWPLIALLNQAGLLVVWGVAAWQIYNQRITLGVLTASLGYVTRIYARLESMSRMATITQRAAASAQRIFEVLDRVPSVPEPAQPVHPGRLRGAVELRNVSFRFGNRQVIDDVSLSIRPGEMIGLVGTTGAGKSTLVNLACRFYDVSEGGVFVDGADVRSYPVSEFRRNIGIVLQEPFLFYGTIADNIAYGKPDAPRDEIIAAARAARAHEFILQLPDGYDSIVGERGQTLSGGERQRISIARALLIDPRILILDEATSSVDTQTERQIQEALDNLVRGRTTIAIAHRLSTLRKADRLVVLERGRIVEIGNHAELLGAGGVYARLYQAQMHLTQDSAMPEEEPASPLPVELLRAEEAE